MRGRLRAGREAGTSLYLGSRTMVMREMSAEPAVGDLVIRPVARDPHMAGDIGRLFAELGASAPDRTVMEEALLCCLMRVLQQHSLNGSVNPLLTPPVNKAIQRLEAAPEITTSLADLAALSGVAFASSSCVGFSVKRERRPHAHSVQLRVRLLAAFLQPAQARSRPRCCRGSPTRAT